MYGKKQGEDYKPIYGVIHSLFRYLFLNNFEYISNVEKTYFSAIALSKVLS